MDLLEFRRLKVLIDIGLEQLLTNKRLIGIVIFFSIINLVPGLLIYAISLSGNILRTSESMYDILARWQITLTSNIVSIILPLYASNATIGEQFRRRTMFNLVSRPVRRESIAATSILTSTLVLGVIGLLIGAIQYLTIYASTRLTGNFVVVPPELLYQTSILLVFFTPFYFSLASAIQVATKDMGLKTMIVYFFITLLFDLVFGALGGNYVYITLLHYRNSLIYQTAPTLPYRDRIGDLLSVDASSLGTTIIAILIPSVVAVMIYILTLAKSDLP